MISAAEMGKQNVVMPEELAMSRAMAAADPAHDAAFLPPRLCPSTRFAGRKKLFSQLDLGSGGGGEARVGVCVESMRASSPTHSRASALVSTSPVAAHDEELERWMRQHPSALGNFGDVVEASKGKRIVMFLDYDGTLSPIVDDPDRAFISDAMRDVVRDTARHFPTAIVSGRCRDKVFSFVQLQELYYAGSHGMDISGPSKGTRHAKSKAKAVSFQPASEFLPIIDEVYKALVEKTKSISGSRVENNTFTLSVHFRCVDENKWNLLAEQVRSVLKDYPRLQLTLGRMVLEIRPTIEWDKGKALEYLLESLGFANSSNVFPVYIGDDRTDEDAFKVLRERGLGLGILVSKFAKETNASFSLREPAEVMELLHLFVDWKRGTSKK